MSDFKQKQTKIVKPLSYEAHKKLNNNSHKYKKQALQEIWDTVYICPESQHLSFLIRKLD